jgi:aromatic-L-amino-acid/L-tryptophan decarboxylase
MQQIDQDVSADMIPLVLIGNAGSYNIGQCDDINQLNAICTKYSIWLHLEGVYLSTLILYSVPTEIQPVASGDSITLNLSTWIGVPSLSYIVRIFFIFFS